LAWETVILKVPGSKKLSRPHKHNWLCPKCEGKNFTIPYHTYQAKGAASKKFFEDELEFHVLICDRCAQFMVFEGCTAECASFPKSKCEICGKNYCTHCGITADFDFEGKHVELRYCNDHIPEWYKNR
jgi:predicted nucleic-acid-binding Zn-ribbon protein